MILISFFSSSSTVHTFLLVCWQASLVHLRIFNPHVSMCLRHVYILHIKYIPVSFRFIEAFDVLKRFVAEILIVKHTTPAIWLKNQKLYTAKVKSQTMLH